MGLPASRLWVLGYEEGNGAALTAVEKKPGSILVLIPISFNLNKVNDQSPDKFIPGHYLFKMYNQYLNT